MDIFMLLLLCVSFAIISSVITNCIRKMAIKNDLYDVPNQRSSHAVPIPKGGGASIVTLLMITIVTLSSLGLIEMDFSMSLIIGISIVAVIALIDDYKNLPILVRALAYIVAAMLAVFCIGGLSHISINDYNVQLNYFGYPLSVLCLVWLTNLYNFMDGTDGFAAIQTVCVGLFCGLLLLLSGQIPLSIILFCLVSSTIGFLYWNWSPAKIFMGDVGSCTIGFLFGLLLIYTVKTGLISMSVWLILLSPFIGDATYTLIKRILNREKWYKAHNSHAYQKIYQLGLSHSKLAISLLVINILVIWPIGYIANEYKSTEFAMLILAYTIIGVIWLIAQNKKLKVLN
jgi:glycosyltransferase WbpL